MKERRRARPEQHDPLLLGQEDKQGGAPGAGGSALWQALSDCLSILFLLGYAVCYSVGQMSIYRMRRIHRRLLRVRAYLYASLRRQHEQNRRALHLASREWLRPLRQFLLIFTYLRSARQPLREEDRLPTGTVVRVVGGRLLHAFWRLLVTLFNILAPIAAIWFLVHTVQYYTSLRYGLMVEYNGEQLGIIDSEARFDEAEELMRERIIHEEYQSPNDTIPRFTLQIMGDEEYLDTQELADKLIRLSGNDLFEAYGVYIDGRFIGAMADCDWLLTELDQRLTLGYSDPETESVRFSRSFQVRRGLYPVSSTVGTQDIFSLLDSEVAAERRYTVQAGDMPINIARHNGISLEELERLNPGVTESLMPGDSLLISGRVPYLRLLSVRSETLQEEIPYTTNREVDNNELIGYFSVVTDGEPGLREVVSNVTYLDGEQLSSEVVSSRIIRNPVPQHIIVGGKRPSAEMLGENDIVEDLDGGMFMWPVDGGKITMPIWGYAGHTGNDITAIPAGTTIRAAATGTVIYSGYTAWGYGRHIIIDHGNGIQTLYAHNSRNTVQVGDEVVQGQKIGEVGQTGNAYGNHCHFEIRKNGQYLDARDYIGAVCPR